MMRHAFEATLTVFTLVLALAPASSAQIGGELEQLANFGADVAAADFNGDGIDDLAVGAPNDHVNGARAAGTVTVIYGTSNGLRTIGNQVWHQDAPGVPGAAEQGDAFSQLRTGDFNGDGFADLAVGAAYEDIGDIEDAGAIVALYGSVDGLQSAGSTLFSLDDDGIPLDAAEVLLFGQTMTEEDFDGDGYSDMAVSLNRASINGVSEVGGVVVLYGSADGLQSRRSQLIHQGTVGIEASPENGDWWARVIATDDFDADGFGDLVVGTPIEGIGTASSAGSVHVIYGSEGGLEPERSQLWARDTEGVPGDVNPYDYFGELLAAGMFDADMYPDLAISHVPLDAQTGGITILRGSSNGLSSENVAMLDSSHIDVPFTTELGLYGRSDLNSDGFDELILHASDAAFDETSTTGAIEIVHGSEIGFGEREGVLIHHAQSDVRGDPDLYDQFGNVVAVGDFDGDGRPDLAIGARGANVHTIQSAGAVHVMYGDGTGFPTDRSELWYQGHDATGVALEESATMPQRVRLHENFPDPFNPATTIRFELPQPQDVRLAVYDVVGREVDVLHKGRLGAGIHAVDVHAAGWASGSYLFRLSTPERIVTKMMTLTK